MPKHPLRAVRLYVDHHSFGFPLPPARELPDEVADDYRYLVGVVELPAADSDKPDMRDGEDD